MAERRLRLDLTAYGFLIAGLLAALSVFSYDPADSPGLTSYPPHRAPRNFLGFPGAWCAQTLYDALGVVVYVLLTGWFILVLLFFLRRSMLTWALRLAGWLLLIP